MPPPLAAPTLGLPIPAEADDRWFVSRLVAAAAARHFAEWRQLEVPAVFLREQIPQRANQVHAIGILRMIDKDVHMAGWVGIHFINDLLDLTMVSLEAVTRTDWVRGSGTELTVTCFFMRSLLPGVGGSGAAEGLESFRHPGSPELGEWGGVGSGKRVVLFLPKSVQSALVSTKSRMTMVSSCGISSLKMMLEMPSM